MGGEGEGEGRSVRRFIFLLADVSNIVTVEPGSWCLVFVRTTGPRGPGYYSDSVARVPWLHGCRGLRRPCAQHMSGSESEAWCPARDSEAGSGEDNTREQSGSERAQAGRTVTRKSNDSETSGGQDLVRKNCLSFQLAGKDLIRVRWKRCSDL